MGTPLPRYIRIKTLGDAPGQSLEPAGLRGKVSATKELGAALEKQPTYLKLSRPWQISKIKSMQCAEHLVPF